MPAIYSTLTVTEADYGERIIRVHGGHHYAGVSRTSGVDLVTGERVEMPISTSWDSATQREVRVSEEGWTWRPIPLADAERRAGLPKGSLPPYSDPARHDLWIDERMRNPTFITLLTVLSAHPEIVFYSVDWRCWVHHLQPREYPHREDSAALTAPRQTTGRGSAGVAPLPLSARRQRRHGTLRLRPLPMACGCQQPRRRPGARHV